MRRLAQATVGLAGLVFSVALTAGLIGGMTTADANPVYESAISTAGQHLGSVLVWPAAAPASPEPETDDASWSADLAESPGTVIYRICRVTAYSDRGTTASGVPVGVGQCAAPADIPFGAQVHIPALGRTFVVTDRTHRRFRRSTVDIFIPSSRQCRQFGCRYLECHIKLPAKVVTKLRS